MLKKSQARKTVLRSLALTTVSLLAMPAAAQTLTTATATRASTVEAGPIRPMYGAIRPFYGAIRPFYGAIRPFYGAIRPFYGAIRPFDGDLTPFWGAIRPFNGEVTVSGGALSPAYGAIRPFWGDIEAQWGAIRPFWGAIRPFEEAPADYATLAGQLRQIETSSQTFWGAAVTARTNKSFTEAFAAPLYAKYGIDLNDPESLGGFDELKREQFFLDWYDGLMAYSGADQVDHWMETVNWTPSLTQQQGGGTDAKIGLLDFSVSGDAGLLDNITKTTGMVNTSNSHGVAVASLLVAPHDGKGVMGIAPNASLITYNPFDASNTADWPDITKGLVFLSKEASVINMSLGVPGYTLHPGWNDVFKNKDVASKVKNTVYVLAAGNDGVTQSGTVAWNLTTDPALIVVGSVNPLGEISDFSNRPGSTCLQTGLLAPLGGALGCATGSNLKDRFIVAPGEMLLTSDGKGGTQRVSGTSFAAPLVSGAVSLLLDRWPWLKDRAKETTTIILKSARDLGAPGVDDVYGVGLLDITASQSPLSMDALKWYTVNARGDKKETTATALRNTSSATRAAWETSGAYVFAYETVGTTYRDFLIPLSSKLVGKTASSYANKQEMFQSYLNGRMSDWLGGPVGFAQGGDQVRIGNFTQLGTTEAFGAPVTVATAPQVERLGFVQSPLGQQTLMQFGGGDSRSTVSLGFGEGAAVLNGQAGFGLSSSFDSERGGANPLLGMASGGGFADFAYRLSPRLSISAGLTQATLERDLTPSTSLLDSDRRALMGVNDFAAAAQHLKVSYRFSDAVTLSSSYTRLDERNSLLGVQSLDRNDLTGGSTTDGVTVGGDVALGSGLRLSASGTLGRTRSGDQQALMVSRQGVLTSAYEVALAKQGVFDDRDQLRLSASQPMHIERGQLELSTVQVIDRSTGELGPVVQRFGIDGQARPNVVELLYGRAIGGRAQVSLFGRSEFNLAPERGQATTHMAGGQLKLSF